MAEPLTIKQQCSHEWGSWVWVESHFAVRQCMKCFVAVQEKDERIKAQEKEPLTSKNEVAGPLETIERLAAERDRLREELRHTRDMLCGSQDARDRLRAGINALHDHLHQLITLGQAPEQQDETMQRHAHGYGQACNDQCTADETTEGPETGAAGPNHVHEWLPWPNGYERCYCGAKR